MADRRLPVPSFKAVRAKIANQTKTKEPSQKDPSKQNPSKTDPPLEPTVVVVPVVPVDQSEDQALSIHQTSQTKCLIFPQISQTNLLIIHQIHQTLHQIH